MKIIECPRDAMQGIERFIPTNKKVEYINSLLKIGFDTIDAGSFVSAKAIPQMADTAKVIPQLDIESSKSKLLVIVANERGAEEASSFEQITYLGFPFSISETFQKKNINSTIKESLIKLEKIQNIAINNNKKLVTYFSMAFGNPYGDEWSAYIVAHWAEKLLNNFGINILSLSDTIGTSNKESISWLFNKLIQDFPEVEFGAHLHTNKHEWKEKIDSAIINSCTRFDTAILGMGGCPMATDNLTGNMPTENLISYLEKEKIPHTLDKKAFNNAVQNAKQIFKI